MSEIVYLSDVRLSFPALAEPQRNKQYPDKPPSYNADFIMETNHPGFQQFWQRYMALAQDKWKEQSQVVLGMIANDRKLRCYGEGKEKINQKTLQPWAGYVGFAFISANKYADKGMPQMIRPDGTAVDPTNLMEYQAVARKMYGGCRVNAAVKPWLQQNSHGRGVRCDLIAVQFLRDDEPFGDAHADATGLFGQVAGAPATPAFGAVGGAPGGMPAFMGISGAGPAAAPAMPAPPTFGAPQMPSFFGR